MKESQKTKVLDWLKGGNTLEPAQAKELGMGMRLASIIEVLRNKEHYHIIDLNEGTKDNWSKYALATGTHCKPSEAVKGPDTQSHTKRPNRPKKVKGSTVETKCVGLHQVDKPCTGCGSYYRQGNQCNICGRVN